MSVVKTLALLALLAGVADSNEVSSVVCVDRPTIYAKTAIRESGRGFEDAKYIFPLYGEVITVHCTGSSSLKLTFQSNNSISLQATQLNTTTIQLFLNLDEGDHEYHCIDTTNQCQDTLKVKVVPAITVISTRISVNNLSGITTGPTYFVPKGEIFSVYCSGNYKKLFYLEHFLYHDDDHGVVSVADDALQDTVNETSIKHTQIANFTNMQFYECDSIDAEGRYWVSPKITVKYYPVAQNFRCIVQYYYPRKFECSWNSSSTTHSFKLFFNFEDHMGGNYSILICAQSTGELFRTCTSDCPLEDGAFVLETCGDFCDNQTLPFKVDSILKLLPYEFSIVNTSFDGVEVKIRVTDVKYSIWCCMSYKAEYRLLGSTWLPANITLNQQTYTYRVDLPCPDTYYEVRVYIRTKQATADWLWSEPVSVYFSTDPKAGDDLDLDPICYPERNMKRFFKYMLPFLGFSA